MRNEYPHPDFVRNSFISLDEAWDFSFDDQNVGHKEKWYRDHAFEKKIEVPFAFESKLSGIADTSYHDAMWYHKEFQAPSLKKEERLILHFEGVDYYSEVYLNGEKVREHYDGNVGYFVDITDNMIAGKNDLVVYCYDPCQDTSIPRGKQDWEETSHAIWYTRTSGIYKPVWMEVVNAQHIARFFETTDLAHFQLSFDTELTTAEGTISFKVADGNNVKEFTFAVTKAKATYVFVLPNDFVNERLWSPERPFLFDLTLTLKDSKGSVVDMVKSYLGLREVKTEGGKVLLNGRPIYQKLVLNQGYYRDGILTAPSVEAMEKDIRLMKEMGFNGCRIHQKSEDPYYLYLCDKMGLIVWQECPAAYGYSSYSPRRELNEWIDIVKAVYNHPCILTYTPLNESWGVEGIPNSKLIQAHALSLYYTIKSLDSSRLVVSNDGWEQCTTDLLTVHNYGHGAKDDLAEQKRFADLLSTREKILRYENINRFIINPGYQDEGQPIILSEFGGIAYKKDTGGKAWGYTVIASDKDYESELRRIYAAIKKSDCIVGICYTQLTDVEQEVNGLLTYDREPKIELKTIKAINDSLSL